MSPWCFTIQVMQLTFPMISIVLRPAHGRLPDSISVKRLQRNTYQTQQQPSQA